ncbi:hypothetical protein N7414_23055 [Pseudomonas sp. GD04087]|uniref:hypothetical protein n=1 Tax=unclassified Pseudomonas TaxID=196821 RepID=UPI00244B39D4|nr:MULTISPECIES: hypothetical protein [unclassified Pseudomonas]MDH0292013.1 hypothetical protein [Pseudomonas sp. GD04087]MDH1052861.1 hypothetical protein [Pseudomonas sp. GD03903]MDH2002024.1 hypothetical protein [Pseudomonas sp. GD03691]
MTDSPLARWRRLIDDRRQWKLTPDYHRAELEGLARKALELRMINHREFVEMYEIAEAGRLTMLEDLAHEAFKRTGVYDVVDEGTGELLGEILSGTFLSAPPAARGILGRITYDEAGQLAMYDGSPAEWKGDVKGLTWTLKNGLQARLVETGRIVAGKVVRAITDADAFRLALDAHQVAQEEGDAARASALALLIELGRFRRCPACRDSFADREECESCGGLGFISKPA